MTKSPDTRAPRSSSCGAVDMGEWSRCAVRIAVWNDAGCRRSVKGAGLWGRRSPLCIDAWAAEPPLTAGSLPTAILTGWRPLPL